VKRVRLGVLLAAFSALCAGILLSLGPEVGREAQAIPLIEHPQFNWNTIFSKAAGGNIAPCRALADPYPAYNSVALDPEHHIAALSDNNLKSVILYDLAAGSKEGTDITPYLNLIKGPDTHISGASGVAVDPLHKRVYFVDTDIGEAVSSWPYGVSGNAHGHVLAIPVTAYGIGLSVGQNKEAITMEDTNAIMVFQLDATGVTPPLYQIRGLKTRLEDPHGLYWDNKNHEIVVDNHGDWNRGYWDIDYNGGGHYSPPSIEVFSDSAQGNAAPVRVIQGSNTELNWPYQISVDTVHDEIGVANYMGHSILIFKRTAEGNAAPIRVIKGPHTGLTGPMGVAFDEVNGEIWVTNFGHTALVFDRMASGDAEPKRIVRSAPPGVEAAGFSNPYALTYDTKRNQLLVRN
jgi:DNA-binding beta-propeller fold protein YncE